MDEVWSISLSFLESPDKSFIGKQQSFANSPISLGRSDDNDMVIPDPAVSRNHLTLRITTDFSRVFITDTSTHGTEVSGKIVPKGLGSGFTLENGDTIKIGNTILQYELKLKSSVQSTMIGKMDRNFLDKPPDDIQEEEIDEISEIITPDKPSAIQEETKKFSPIYIGFIVVCLLIILFLLFGSSFFG